MLRTNLSTRPFYNDRVVRLALGTVAVAAIGLTIFNVAQVWRLQAASREQNQTLRQNEEQATELRRKARVIRQGINREQLEAVQASSREANELIDRRAFSWTQLLNQFQITLPADVRITAVQPQIDPEGRMLVAVTVISRKVEDLDAFIEALEKTGSFSGVLPRQDAAEDDGTRRSVLQAYYRLPDDPVPVPATVPSPPPATVPGPPASEPVKEAR